MKPKPMRVVYQLMACAAIFWVVGIACTWVNYWRAPDPHAFTVLGAVGMVAIDGAIAYTMGLLCMGPSQCLEAISHAFKRQG